MIEIIKRVVKYTCATIIFSIILIFTSFIFLVYGYFLYPLFAHSKLHSCVKLKNGLNIGYNAVLDLRQPYWRSYVVPKLPDGTPLVEGDVWPIYVTDSTLYGTFIGETGDKDYRFVWRADTGLVRADEDPETYGRLISEAGPANVGLGTGAYGTTIVMRWLMERPEYANQWCTTKYLTW